MRIIERLLRLENGARGNGGLGQRVDRLGARARGAPCRHALGDHGAVVAAQDVRLEARVGEPHLLAHQVGPALVERVADHLDQDPHPILALEEVHGARRLATIGGGDTIGFGDRLLDQQRIAERHGGGEQRAFDPLAAAGHLAGHQRRHGAEGAMQRGAEIDPGHLRPERPFAIGLARHVDGARHGLADAVETDAVRVRATAAVGRHGREDDVLLDGLEALVVELHGFQRLRRQVGNDHVGGRDQLAHDLLALGLHRIERHAELVAVHLHEQRALAARRDRRLHAILARRALLDADHLRAVLCKHAGAVGARDVAAEIEYAYPFQDARHSVSSLQVFARLFALGSELTAGGWC